MAHTFLALDMALIPQDTKDYIPNFWLGKFSNNQERLLIDGYNEQRELVQPDELINVWLQWEDNPQETFTIIMESSTEYTKDEMLLEFNNEESIWYSKSDGELNG